MWNQKGIETMNAKQLIASGMAVLMLAGGILGNSVQTQAGTTTDEYTAITANMQTEYIQVDDLAYRAGKYSVR